ncbi:cytochrome b5-like heme/steroid binding domain-containing protein [Xylogone sp. PMI_703]|nr:cytochrome b5-like heme/steroid binding domain-containing protein [Xylogone sp. PMI_703]
MAATFTLEDVAKHTTQSDCWLVIHGKVYDATPFLDDHPGGAEIVLETAGRDASTEFDDVNHSEEATAELEKLLVGTLGTKVADPVPSEPLPAAAVTKSVSKDSSLLIYLGGILGSVLAIGLYFNFIAEVSF